MHINSPKSKRIALFFPSLKAGGVQRFMLTLGAGLQADGYDVDFVLVEAKGPFLDQTPTGIRIIDLKSKRAVTALPALVRYLKSETPEVMISAQTHINVIAIIACRLVNAKTRLVISERNHITSSSRNSTKVSDRFRPIFARLFYPLADAIVAVSKDVGIDLARRTGLPGQRIQVVNNSYHVDIIEQKAAEPVDHLWLISSGPPVFLAVGRLDKQKDYLTLLHAFADVRSKIDARLIILGEGHLRPALEMLAQQLGISVDVSLPGFVSNPYAYMAKASVYVLSSAWEGFPNVLVEALACQVQVVSTDCHSGPAEILDGGRYGRLVPVGDPSALATAMLEAMRDPLPVNLLRARAADFTVEKSVRGYLHAAGIRGVSSELQESIRL
jgi:glycosyltransferase involved in cell wall biosynthesis